MNNSEKVVIRQAIKNMEAIEIELQLRLKNVIIHTDSLRRLVADDYRDDKPEQIFYRRQTDAHVTAVTENHNLFDTP